MNLDKECYIGDATLTLIILESLSLIHLLGKSKHDKSISLVNCMLMVHDIGSGLGDPLAKSIGSSDGKTYDMVGLGFMNGILKYLISMIIKKSKAGISQLVTACGC